MIVGGFIFNSAKESKADPNWIAIIGLLIFFAGIAALTKGCN